MAIPARGGGGDAAPASFEAVRLAELRVPDGVVVRAARGTGDVRLLPELEHAQAAGFGERRRASFLLGRSLLRVAAAEVLAVDPTAIPVGERPAGGLELAGLPWHINLTHAGEVAGCVMARMRVGIDVEAVRPRSPALWSRMLAAGEGPVQWPGWSEDEHVLLTWTAKEAALKASGIGLRQGARAAILMDAQDEGLLRAATPGGVFAVALARREGHVWAVAWEVPG